MEQRLADLLSDAFSESSVSPFLDEDLEFENLNFDGNLMEDKTGIAHEDLTKEDESLQQEASGQFAVLSSSDGDSEQEGSVSGEGEENEQEDMGPAEEPGDLLMSVHCSDELCAGNIEDRIFAEGQLLTPEGAKKPQVRNKEQGDAESDGEVSYFEKVPESGSEMVIKGGRIEEDKQEMEEEKQVGSSDSECEGMKTEQEENVSALCIEHEVENPCRISPASLEFPEISVQNLQDFINEAHSEENVEKIWDFSGDEHQEAGESFADYPSDFSSCEYVQDGEKTQESNHQSVEQQKTGLERAVTDVTWIGRAENSDEEGDEYLYSIDLEVDADKFRTLNGKKKDSEKIEIVEHVLDDAVLTGCDNEGVIGESDSYSSSDSEVHVKTSDEELLDSVCLQDSEYNTQLEEPHSGNSAAFARRTTPDDYSQEDLSDVNINWNADVFMADTHQSEDLLTTVDADEVETLCLDETAGDFNTYSTVQRGDAKTTSPSTQGSLDDSFLFKNELKEFETTVLGQLGDDEHQEDRNWKQEQERIKAFYEFYDDSDEEYGREGRQTKVKFCPDPLSQLIRYETDSSDRDSFSSSTEGEEDLSSGETSEDLREPDDNTQMKPACDPPNAQPVEKELDRCSTQKSSRKHRCLNILMLTLKMGLVILMGLLMFWLATDQAGWFGQLSFF